MSSLPSLVHGMQLQRAYFDEIGTSGPGIASLYAESEEINEEISK
jgi:hypothetical protein